MSDEYSRLRSLLVQFPDFQKTFESYSLHEQNLLTIVSAIHSSADRGYLEGKFLDAPCRGHMSEDDRYVFMTPFSEADRTFLPLLSVDLDYTRPWPMISVNCLHYALRNGRTKIEEVNCFGYRFDKPAVKTGEHDYFHAQFVHGYPKGTRNPLIADWISTKDPSIPIDAANPIEMFLSAVIGLRNRHKSRREYLDEWSQAGIPIRGILDPMAMTRWKPAKPQPSVGG